MKASPSLLIFSPDADETIALRTELRKSHLEKAAIHVSSPQALISTLRERTHSAAICLGNHLDTISALLLVKNHRPDLPVIIVSEKWDEEAASECFRAGASDCISHDKLSRLPTAVIREIESRETPDPSDLHERQEPSQTAALLRSALAEISGLKHVLDQHVIVATTDRAGRITSANEKFCQLSGYAREELIGKDHRILNSGEHPKEFFRDLWATIRRGEIWRGEIRNRAKDGTGYWVDTVIIPQLDPDGRPIEYIAIRTDITRLKELETHLEAARDQAMEVSRLKSEFLANMSHEIRTPMNGIIGMSGLLLEMDLADEPKHMAKIIQSSADSLLTIINDILDFSRIEAGKMRLDCCEFSLDELIEETVEMLRPCAAEKNLSLIYHLPQEPTGLLNGDPGRIRQILLNLLGNGIKFTQQGAILVMLSIVQEAPERTRFKISVRDTGCGISPEQQDRLFQPFTQVDGSITRSYGGTGLGLAISRRMVELMNGQIGFESQPGTGSTFWFEIELQRRAEREPTDTGRVLSDRRVLIVDDKPHNREILSRQLAEYGVQTQLIGDANSALALVQGAIEAPPWDLILLDYQMPDKSGLDLARAIRRNPRLSGIPIVMLSSSGATFEIDEALYIGFAAILTKPVRAEQLHKVVLTSLRHREAKKPATQPDHTETTPPLRILLAEDHPSNQAVMQAMLEQMGHFVDLAVDGAHALDLLAEKTYDVVLMDCQMPVLDGYETTRRIRAGELEGIDPAVRIVALTAHALPQDRTKCLEAGMNDYLTKPIHPARLAARLRYCAKTLEKPPLAAPPHAKGAVLDLETIAALRSLDGGKPGSLLARLVTTFQREVPDEVEELKALANSGQWEDIASKAHRLSNTSAALGAIALRGICLAVEAAAQQSDLHQIRHCLAQLEASLELVLRALDEIDLEK